MKNSSKNSSKKNWEKWAFGFAGVATAIAFAFLFAQAKNAAGAGASALTLAGAPPENAGLAPFAAVFGVALLVVFSALVWYVPIELAWKKK